MRNKVFRAVVAVVVAALFSTAMTVGSAAADPKVPEQPVPASGVSAGQSQAELAIEYTANVRGEQHFDREAAIEAGLDPHFADEYEEALDFVANADRKPGSLVNSTASPVVTPYWTWQQTDCIINIALYAGASVAVVAAAFATGGAAALAWFGLAGASYSVLRACHGAFD